MEPFTDSSGMDLGFKVYGLEKGGGEAGEAWRLEGVRRCGRGWGENGFRGFRAGERGRGKRKAGETWSYSGLRGREKGVRGVKSVKGR